MKVQLNDLRRIIREELKRHSLNEDSAKTTAGKDVEVNPSSKTPPTTDGVSFVLSNDGDISNLLSGGLQVFKGIGRLKNRAFGVKATGNRPDALSGDKAPYGAQLNLLYNPIKDEAIAGTEDLVFQPNDMVFTGRGGEDVEHALKDALRFEMVELDPESIWWMKSRS
jgi:hypothetical protein